MLPGGKSWADGPRWSQAFPRGASAALPMESGRELATPAHPLIRCGLGLTLAIAIPAESGYCGGASGTGGGGWGFSWSPDGAGGGLTSGGGSTSG